MAKKSYQIATVIGYDTSESAYDLSVICAACAETEGDRQGTALYAGEEWGGPLPRCSCCGAILVELVEVAS